MAVGPKDKYNDKYVSPAVLAGYVHRYDGAIRCYILLPLPCAEHNEKTFHPIGGKYGFFNHQN